MSNRTMLKEAIADAKTIKETAIANAKAALEESFTPHIKEMLSAKLQEMDKDEDLDEAKKDDSKDKVEEMDAPSYKRKGGESLESVPSKVGKSTVQEEEEKELDEMLAELESEIEEGKDKEKSKDELKEEEGDEDADEEITAVLLKKKNPLAILTLPNLLRDTPMQVALPAIEMNRLTQQFGIGLQTLRAVALLIMGLSFISVFIALYASLRDRRYELALLRTMGAPPQRLFALVLFEGLWMTAAGIFSGLLLSRLGVMALGQVLADRFHYDVTQLAPVQGEFVLVAAALLVGAFAAGIPARSALRIDISNILVQGR